MTRNRIVSLFVIYVTFLSQIAPCYAARQPDAMQDIAAKKAQVEAALKDIIDRAAANTRGRTIPDPALERAIAQLEDHLRSMDLRLESLPTCQKAPGTPNTQIALRRLDPKQNIEWQKEYEAKVKAREKRGPYLLRVETTTKAITKAKAVTSLAGLATSLIPGAGLGWDWAGVVDSYLSWMGQNPFDTYTPRQFRGSGEYRQYLSENRAELIEYMKKRVAETLQKDPNYKFTEQDVIWWPHAFNLEKLPKDRLENQQQLEYERQVLENLKKKVQTSTAANTYFEGLARRFEDAVGASKWLRNPKQFEKMNAELKITVLDDSTGQPIAAPAVDVMPAPGTRRNAGNPYEFENVSSGNNTIRAAAPGFVTENAQVDVSGCQVYPVSFRLKKRPVIRIADVKDEDGRLIDDVKVDVTDAVGGAPQGNVYRRTPLRFIVDPGSFTVTGTDNGSTYEVSSQSVNADAGAEIDVHLTARKKGGAIFVVEVFDALSGTKLDPPPGGDEPGAKLEPLDGQPSPLRQTYAGNGELPFGSIRAGNYKYHASMPGWESANGTFSISPDELKSKRIVRRVSLKPKSLDSFTGNVVEIGTDMHVNGFKVSFVGLGARQGFRYETSEGKDPNPNSHTLFGAFIIKGPIYSGRYKLVIKRDCYEDIVLDSWMTFALDRGAYTPQIFRMNATAQFEESRREARALIAQIKQAHQKASAAADQIQNARRASQDLADLASGLSGDLTALKQAYPTLAQECSTAATEAAEIKRVAELIDGGANKITILRETVKNLAGVTCELSEKALTATEIDKATNLKANSGQFAKQTNKTAGETKQLADEMRRQANLLGSRDFRSIEQSAGRLRSSFGGFKSRLQDLRNRVNAASQASASLAQANAAVAEANWLNSAVQNLLGSCSTTASAQALLTSAETARGGVTVEQKRAESEAALLQTFYANAKSAAVTAENLGGEIETTLSSCDAAKGLDGIVADAKAKADTAEVFAQAANESAKTADKCAVKATSTGAGLNGADTPTVELLPEDTSERSDNASKKDTKKANANRNPVVEELPEDRNPGPQNTTSAKNTKKPGVEPSKVEVLPEDSEPVRPNTIRDTVPKTTPAKTSEEDDDGEEEEEDEPTSNSVQNTPKTNQAKKPGFGERVGKILGAIAEGINTTNLPKGGGIPPVDPPRRNDPQDVACSAADREVWEKISGTWQAKYGNVTFSGSCGNVTGFWMQGTFGHPLRKDGTDQRGEIKEGKVKGGGLSFQFFQPWGDQRKGSDSCYLYVGDKQLSCSYLGSLSR